MESKSHKDKNAFKNQKSDGMNEEEHEMSLYQWHTDYIPCTTGASWATFHRDRKHDTHFSMRHANFCNFWL